MGSVLSTEQQKPRRDRGKLKGRMEQAPQELSNAAGAAAGARRLSHSFGSSRQGGGTCIWAVPPVPSSLVPQMGMLRHVPAVLDGVPNLSSSSNLKRAQTPEE